MKVVCKNNQVNTFYEEDEYEFSMHLRILASDKYGKKGDNHLILNKIYDVIDTDTYKGYDINKKDVIYYLIENETGLTFWYADMRFISLEEYRSNKLDKIGI